MIGADYIRKQFYFRLRTCTSDSPIYKKKRLDVISGQFDLPPRVSAIQKRREVRSEGETMSEPIGIRQHRLHQHSSNFAWPFQVCSERYLAEGVTYACFKEKDLRGA